MRRILAASLGLFVVGCTSESGEAPLTTDDDGPGSSAASTGRDSNDATDGADTGSSTAAEGSTAVDAETMDTGAPETTDDTGVPIADGWTEIAGTMLADVCPTDPAVQGNTGCKAVIAAWNGGIADTMRDRLIFLGGGHGDYYGNEVYALDLNALSLERLNEPSPLDNLDECPSTYVDGTPAARHTYDALAYIEHADRMFMHDGALPPCGGAVADTWTLDLATLEWTDMQPSGGPEPRPGKVADYDPDSGAVYLHDTYAFWRYDYDTNTFTELAASFIDYHMTGRIDPVRREFVILGCRGCDPSGGAKRISIAEGSDYQLEDITASLQGCDALIETSSPGLAFDTVGERLVGWAGGNDVYALDLETLVCTRYESEGGPPPPPELEFAGPYGAQGNGTFGRWRYFPDEGVFAVVNDWQQNAFVFRFDG
jgi:hypothetical protein